MLLPLRDKNKIKCAIQFSRVQYWKQIHSEKLFDCFCVSVHAHVCACRYACVMVRMEVRRQLFQVGSLLSPGIKFRSWGLCVSTSTYDLSYRSLLSKFSKHLKRQSTFSKSSARLVHGQCKPWLNETTESLNKCKDPHFINQNSYYC